MLLRLATYPVRRTVRMRRERKQMRRVLGLPKKGPAPYRGTARTKGGPPLPPPVEGPAIGSVPRRAWLPPLVVAGLLAAGWGIARLVGGGSPLAVCVALVVLSGGVWTWRVRPANRRAAAVLVGLAALWVALPVSFTSSRHWLVFWLVLAAVIERRWEHFRIRPPVVKPPGPADKWAATLGEKGPLAGSTMGDPEKGREQSRPVVRDGKTIGFEMLWKGIPGQHNASSLLGQRENVASLYGVEPGDVVIERIGDASKATVSVFTTSPFANPRVWNPEQLDLRTGRVELSTFPDGARGSLQAWVPGQGVKHTGIFGSTGSGKTDTVNAYLGSLMCSGRVVLDLVDLGGGSSLAAWKPACYRFGTTPTDALAALERGNAVMDARSTAMRTMASKGADGRIHEGVTCLDPTEDWPLYLVVIEEWPEVCGTDKTSKLARDRANRIGRLGRKHGVAICIVSQPASLQSAFPDCPDLRDQIKNGNVIGLRSGSTQGRMAFGSLDVDLSSIPKGKPGLGYVSSDATDREVLSRVDWPASPCPGCKGIDAQECGKCGGTGLVSDPWMVVGHAQRGVPNRVDAEAVAECEDSPVPSTEPFVQPPTLPHAATPQDSTLSADDLALDKLMSEIAKDSDVGTGDVAAAFGGKGAYDKVRKGLARLHASPESGVTRTGHGLWMYVPPVLG